MKLLRRVSITLLTLALSLPVIGWVLFRMPTGRAIDGEGVAYLKKIELRVDLRGDYFERPLGNRRLYLDGSRTFFVSTEDWQKVWADGDKRNIRYRAHPVLAGFDVAQILSAESHLDAEAKRPTMR